MTAQFYPPNSSDEHGRLEWLWYLEQKRRLTDGERREIPYLERRLFGLSREDETNNKPRRGR